MRKHLTALHALCIATACASCTTGVSTSQAFKRNSQALQVLNSCPSSVEVGGVYVLHNASGLPMCIGNVFERSGALHSKPFTSTSLKTNTYVEIFIGGDRRSSQTFLSREKGRPAHAKRFKQGYVALTGDSQIVQCRQLSMLLEILNRQPTALFYNRDSEYYLTELRNRVLEHIETAQPGSNAAHASVLLCWSVESLASARISVENPNRTEAGRCIDAVDRLLSVSGLNSEGFQFVDGAYVNHLESNVVTRAGFLVLGRDHKHNDPEGDLILRHNLGLQVEDTRFSDEAGSPNQAYWWPSLR